MGKRNKIKWESVKKINLIIGILASIATVLALILTVSALLSSKTTTPTSTNTDDNLTTQTALSQKTQTEQSIPSYRSVSYTGIGCPKLSPDNPDLPVANVLVRYWCAQALYNVNGDPVAWQYTLRPRIVNNTSQTISVSIKGTSTIRLLVATHYDDKDGGESIDLSANWEPVLSKNSKSSAEDGDKPFLITCDNQQYWAVPPDKVIYSPIKDVFGRNVYQGFSTKWYQEELGPNQTLFFDKLAEDGVLSFHVPDEYVPVYGLTVIDTTTNNILGIAHRDEPQEWANSSQVDSVLFW